MAHILNLTDNATTVSLSNNTTCMLVEYTPKTPEQTTQQVEFLGDGGEVAAARYRNVTETIEVLALGATGALAQAVVTSINNLLQAARVRSVTGEGTPVYLQFRLDSDPVSWRSEILAGRVELGPDALRIWGNFKIPLRIHITRRFYWEHNSSTELQLTSQADSTPATGGKGIVNHAIASTANWVQIAAAQVAGDLPAPVKVEMQNDTGSTQDYRNIYIASYAEAAVDNFSHVIQGETALSGTVGTNADSSNGEYIGSTFSGTTGFTWTLASALLQRMQGRYFRLYGRFRSYTAADIYVQPIIRDATGLVDLAVGDELKLPLPAVQLIDLGTLPFPPGGWSAAWDSALTLFLRMRSATSVTVQVDYIHFFSVRSPRHLIYRNATLADNDQIVDDGLENLTYSVEGGDRHPVLSPRGTPVHVVPGVLQRVYFLHDEGTTSAIGNVTTIRIWYRARRLNV